MTVERSNRCLFCIIDGNNKGRAHILELNDISSSRVDCRIRCNDDLWLPGCPALYQACLQPVSVSSSICWSWIHMFPRRPRTLRQWTSGQWADFAWMTRFRIWWAGVRVSSLMTWPNGAFRHRLIQLCHPCSDDAWKTNCDTFFVWSSSYHLTPSICRWHLI